MTTGSHRPHTTIGMVGDLLVDRPTPTDVFADVGDLLDRTDVLIGNLEGPYSTAPHLAPNGASTVCPPPDNLAAFAAAGFDVLTLANNHILDGGYTALTETRSHLDHLGISTCGAGDDLAQARTPAIIEHHDLTIGVLAYASVFPIGYEATPARPGIAPLRGYNIAQEPLPGYYAPGVIAPIARSVPDDSDFAGLHADITDLHDHVDIVIVSCHWGDFLRPMYLTDHEKRTAHTCIELGADIVMGHHHHTLRGMEYYHGKPIFYGLGHFVFDMNIDPRRFEHLPPHLPDYAVYPREGWPLLPMHPDSRMTALAWTEVSHDHHVAAAGFHPCILTNDGLVHTTAPNTDANNPVLNYIEECNRSQGLDTTVTLHPRSHQPLTAHMEHAQWAAERHT